MERRSSPRVPASEVIPHGVTRLATGQEVALMNIGLNGSILINTTIILSPGSLVRLRMNILGISMNLEGHVQRCRVVGLKQTKVQYEAAIILDGGLPQPLAERLQPLDEQNPQAEQSSLQDKNPDAMALKDTAQLWVLNTQEAGTEAQASPQPGEILL